MGGQSRQFVRGVRTMLDRKSTASLVSQGPDATTAPARRGSARPQPSAPITTPTLLQPSLASGHGATRRTLPRRIRWAHRAPPFSRDGFHRANAPEVSRCRAIIALEQSVSFRLMRTLPKFFGFSEFLAGLALMVLAWTIGDIRYRFRVRSAPLPLQGVTYTVVAAVGVLTY